MNKTEYKNMKTYKRNRAIIIGIFTFIIVYWVVMVGIPLLRGSGVEGYQGAQRAVAENALRHAKEPFWKYFDINIFPTIYFRIDEVRPTTDEEKKAFCSDGRAIPSLSPDEQGYYTVKVSKHSFINPFDHESWTFDGCWVMKYDPGPRNYAR